MNNSLNCGRSITAEINFDTMKAECWMFHFDEAVARWSDSIPTTMPRIDGVLWLIQDIFKQFGDLIDLTLSDLNTDEAVELKELSDDLSLGKEFDIKIVNVDANKSNFIVDIIDNK